MTHLTSFEVQSGSLVNGIQCLPLEPLQRFSQPRYVSDQPGVLECSNHSFLPIDTETRLKQSVPALCFTIAIMAHNVQCQTHICCLKVERLFHVHLALHALEKEVHLVVEEGLESENRLLGEEGVEGATAHAVEVVGFGREG